MKRTAVIENPIQLDGAFRSFYEAAKGVVVAGGRVMLQLGEPAKSRVQEERYHAMIGEIAEQCEVMGKKLDAESWKRLLVDAFKHDTKNDPDFADEWQKFGTLQMLPALNHDGFVAVGEQTRKFSVKLATAFIDWLGAFGAEQGVEFRR
jgi:hypothetical protein